jgi:hypothetical protein
VYAAKGETNMAATVEQRVEQIFEAIEMQQAETYARDCRAFKHALEEAHGVLALDDINELIADANEEFAQDHICTCVAGGTDSPAAPTTARSLIDNVGDFEAALVHPTSEQRPTGLIEEDRAQYEEGSTGAKKLPASGFALPEWAAGVVVATCPAPRFQTNVRTRRKGHRAEK